MLGMRCACLLVAYASAEEACTAAPDISVLSDGAALLRDAAQPITSKDFLEEVRLYAEANPIHFAFPAAGEATGRSVAAAWRADAPGREALAALEAKTRRVKTELHPATTANTEDQTIIPAAAHARGRRRTRWRGGRYGVRSGAALQHRARAVGAAAAEAGATSAQRTRPRMASACTRRYMSQCRYMPPCRTGT